MIIQETVWAVEEEAYQAWVAWNQAMEIGYAAHQEIYTLREQLYAQGSYLQTLQTYFHLQDTWY